MEYNYKIYLLFGLVLIGLINQGFSKPTNQQDEPEYINDEDYNDEYKDTDTDEKSENKSTENTPTDTVTQQPFFPSPHEKYYIKLGTDAELKCLAKHLSSTNILIWYKGDNVIATGKQLTSEQAGHLKILDNNSLLIQNATNDDAGNYYCEIIPQKIKLHVEVEIRENDEEEITREEEELVAVQPEEQSIPPAEHNQASQVGEVTATESNSNGNGCNGKISQSIILTIITIGLTTILRL